MPDGKIYAHLVAYEPEAEIDVSDDGVIQNHDELVADGMTYDVIHVFNDSEANRQHLTEDQIIEPGDDRWREELADLEPGDEVPYNPEDA